MDERRFEFDWDEAKERANVRKHRLSFDLARTIFNDPRLLTVADLEHSEMEVRWFSIGCAFNGTILAVVYRWSEVDPTTTKIRIISARKATQNEIRQYEESL